MDATQTQPAPPPMQRTAKHTILFLAANPSGTTELALGREARAIEEELERSGHRGQFQLVTRWAVQPLDLLRELRKLKPAIVHFSGHGGSSGLPAGGGPRRDVAGEPGTVDDHQEHGLFFEGPEGRSRLVSTAALEETFGAAGSSVKVVVLSACYSELQARALLAHVGCVIGMASLISDSAVRSFAIGFYGGLGECESVGAAFRQGVAAIRLEGIRNDDRTEPPAPSTTAQCASTVRLLTSPDTDPNSIYIVQKPDQNRRCTIVIKATLKEFDAEVITRVRDELRLLTGDVSLEITEVQEGSVRLTVSLSVEAATRLNSLINGGQLEQICGFEVASVVTDLEEAKLGGASPERDSLTGVELSGSRRVEAERRSADLRGATLNRAEIATALLIERTLQHSPAYRKVDESLYVSKQGSTYVMLNVVPWGANRAMVRCTAQLVKGIDVDGPLAIELLELNSDLRFGALSVDPDDHTVLFTHTIPGGHTLDSEELVATLREVALVADELDDKLMNKHGGQRMTDLFEEAAMERILERDPDKKHPDKS